MVEGREKKHDFEGGSDTRFSASSFFHVSVSSGPLSNKYPIRTVSSEKLETALMEYSRPGAGTRETLIHEKT
jgi:hypothetical protein